MPGVKFAPNEEELVRFYYHPKLTEMDFQPDVIPLINLYEHTPQELIDMYPVPANTNHAYFFTERSKINATDYDYDRRAKGGVWEIAGDRLNVFDQNDILMAVKRLYKFVLTAPGNVKSTDWEMIEYSLDNKDHEAIPSHMKDRFALCLISKKQPKKQPSKWQGQPAVHPAVAAGAGQPAVGAAGAGQPAVGAAGAVQPTGAAGAGQRAVAAGAEHPADVAAAWQPPVDVNENYWSGMAYPMEDAWVSPDINLGGDENEDKSPVSKRAKTG